MTYWNEEDNAATACEVRETQEVRTAAPIERLDMLLPNDPATGAVTFAALRAYIGQMMELTGRHSQPLALLFIAVDDSPIMPFFGDEGALLIGRAITRFIRQETRTHDVVGRTAEVNSAGIPGFLVVLPLMTEEQSVQMAERLHLGMTAHSVDGYPPWLSLSVGIVGVTIDIHNADDLIARAASAMRRAQLTGGGKIWRHSDTLRQILESAQSETTENPE